MTIYKGKKVLVTGGTGMIGRPLVEMLLSAGAEVRVVSLDDPSRAHSDVQFLRLNLMDYQACVQACSGIDYVFQLVGVKGSPAMTAKKPASFFVPLLLMNTNMMEAAFREGVERYLYTSSVGVYGPAEVFYEDAVWESYPSKNDWFAGWAKRMGELQGDAYKIEYGWDKTVIVRPANVYGPFDNFDPNSAMVIPSLIRRAVQGENPFVVWGDGSSVRDFIHAKDVARGMMMALEKLPDGSVNLGSGTGIKIRELVEEVVSNMDSRPKIVWDKTKPHGDRRRVFDLKRARKMGFKAQIPLKEGIAETVEWYRRNQHIADKGYNVFSSDRYL
ncbi:GDP-L-fucose synthase [Desulfosarcina ovata subsp. sediminis]|uniref:GDP-L-fucose synthase n=1 Tax=Desulfosarcina ovata subsp. sediminis TaxID=885957 RepID=A0A5K7ZFR7_9BACT|nr:NAD-dependent epimerase/dehydratase family protein [Desulfosarcina ovata]BBO79771.1 GDP-L-fucose synthase [Desulfosarcina ovata subsp. sediminis]